MEALRVSCFYCVIMTYSTKKNNHEKKVKNKENDFFLFALKRVCLCPGKDSN